MPLLLLADNARVRRIRATAKQYFEDGFSDLPVRFPIPTRFGHLMHFPDNGKINGKRLNKLATTLARKFTGNDLVELYGDVVVTDFDELPECELITYQREEDKAAFKKTLQFFLSTFSEEDNGSRKLDSDLHRD